MEGGGEGRTRREGGIEEEAMEAEEVGGERRESTFIIIIIQRLLQHSEPHRRSNPRAGFRGVRARDQQERRVQHWCELALGIISCSNANT